MAIEANGHIVSRRNAGGQLQRLGKWPGEKVGERQLVGIKAGLARH